jgi:hypothetical protein
VNKPFDVEGAERRAKRILDDEASVIQPSLIRINGARDILRLAQMWREEKAEKAVVVTT